MGDYITINTDTHTIVTLPSVDPVPPVSWHISTYAFKKRFPRQKWIAARGLATAGTALYDFFEDWDVAQYMDLQAPELVGAINYMTTVDTPIAYRLTSQEASTILDVPCQVGEEP